MRADGSSNHGRSLRYPQLIDFGEIERKLEKEQQLRLADRRRLYGGD